ncbi:hypothetical protein JCM10296v2_000894 [Rhodotorula toruloides]
MLVNPAVHPPRPAQLPPNGITKVEKASWAVEAAAKKAAQSAFIPSAWRLPSPLLDTLPLDVRPVVAACGLLTARQVTITEIDEASVLLTRLRNGEYSAVEVAEAFCLRAAIAHQLEVVHLTDMSRRPTASPKSSFDSALARAKQLDEHLALTGEPVGPLHGLPVSLKDQFDIANVDSTIGFTSLIGRPAQRNSVLVDLLERLGAIVFCKTNVPQTLMAAETSSNVFGRTVNPRNRNLTSGGSSGGEGALLALKGSIIGVGTDYGGSIRVPSHCCGLYGLRPTTRRLPYAGVTNVMKGYEGMESTIGPMARSIDSLEVFMQAVVGAEPWMFDAKTVERPWRLSIVELPKKLHVAFAFDNGLVHTHPPIRRAIHETVAALARAGHQVTPLKGIDWREARDLVGLISGADGGADLRSFLSSGEPVIPEAFPFAASTSLTVHELSQLMQRRDAFRQDFLRLWRKSAKMSDEGRPFDVVVCPVTTHLAWPHLGRPQDSELITWTTTWSLLDLPACTAPVGELDPLKDAPSPLPEPFFSQQDQQHWDSYAPETFENAPLVVQLVNLRRFREDELLAMARVVEKAVRGGQGEEQ